MMRKWRKLLPAVVVLTYSTVWLVTELSAPTNAAAHRPRDRDERSGHPAVPEALFMAPPGVAAEATSQAAQMAKRAGSSKAGSSKAGSAKRAPARARRRSR